VLLRHIDRKAALSSVSSIAVSKPGDAQGQHRLMLRLAGEREIGMKRGVSRLMRGGEAKGR
jgi:hypothetical protein